MNKSFKTTAQAGFTLIELIVVIVILGILAATAMPKFMNLGGDARAATLQSARAGLNSISELAHARFLANTSGTTLTDTKVEGQTLTYVNGYPKADAGLAAIAAPDFSSIVGPHTADTNSPELVAGELAIIPTAIFGSATAKKCYIKYTEAAAGAKPTLSNAPKGEDCE